MPGTTGKIPVSAMAWLTGAKLQRVFDALQDGGTTRAVGGCVRNALLDIAINDIDLATTHRPETVMARLERAGFKAVPTGVEHGTVTAVAGGDAYEITTLRADLETDGRHAVVGFTEDWREDAARRDFTINAIYCDRDGTLFDPLGGLRDIAKDGARVRFVGNPDQRLREDYLRILRFFRITAQYGSGKLDAAGLKACVRQAAGLAGISRERINVEIFKLLAAEHAGTVLRAMHAHGFLQPYLPGARQFARFDRLVGLERDLGRKPDATLRLAMLYGGRPPVGRLKQLLLLSNAIAKHLGRIAALGGIAETPLSEPAAREMLYRRGKRVYLDFVLLSWAAAARADDAWPALFALPGSWRAPRFALSGGDVMARGVASGPAVGAVLDQVERAWIAAGFPDDERFIETALDKALDGLDR
jgi:poly(A) polymerase